MSNAIVGSGIRRRGDKFMSPSSVEEKTFANEEEFKFHTSPFYCISSVNRICITLLFASLCIFTASAINSNNKRSPRENAMYRDIPIIISSLPNDNWILQSKFQKPPNEFEQEFGLGFYDWEGYYDDEDEEVVHYEYATDQNEPILGELPDNFEQFYNDPILNDYFEEYYQVKEELDMSGYVYDREDISDDDWISKSSFTDFFAFDDDVNRWPDLDEEGDPILDEDGNARAKCRRVDFHRQHHPTCNNIHESVILTRTVNSEGVSDIEGKYLASGSYRDAFRVRQNEAILKVARFWRELDPDLMEMIRVDSMVMDMLSVSPHIVDIYSHCALSVLVEPVNGPSVEDLVLFNLTDSEVKEDVLSPTQKLELALGMAKGVAEIHGYKGGVIAHFDIQIYQFLLEDDLTVRMSDFNRAEPLLYNEVIGEYCAEWLGSAMGILRSPQEYDEIPVDESTDVYSFGNIIYTLLMGDDPYRDDWDLAKESAVNGIPPFVPNDVREHSFGEEALSRIMDKCFEYEARDRVSIFDVVAMLKDAIDLNTLLQKMPASDLEEMNIEEEIQDFFENIATARVANSGYYEERLEDIDEEEHYYYSSEYLKDELRR